MIPLCYFINPNTDKHKIQCCDLSTVLGNCVYSWNILAQQLCIQVLPWVNPVSEKKTNKKKSVAKEIALLI